MSFFVVQDLIKNGAEGDIGRGIAKSTEISFRDDFRHKQDEQLVFQTEETSEQNETTVTPMPAQQRSAQFFQDSRHEAGVLLFFLDKEVNRGLINSISGCSGLLAQVYAFAAFTDLKLLQGANQRKA